MLDGLLGRGGFHSKCKSLIKLTRTRIDVIRRKRNATQKFLRKDIADLLAGGLESTAFARVEGLMTELILTSCYEFIDCVCEIILKQLPVMQKNRECPEDCREAVSSLMYAAARFSDLPELRDLRNIFQERYGSSLEYYVNQKLVENIAPRPPSTEKKLQVLQEIATEFSIKWEPRDFEQRASSSSASAQDHLRTQVPIQAADYKYLNPPVEETTRKPDKNHVLAKNTDEAAYQSKGSRREGTVRSTDEANHKFQNGWQPTGSTPKPVYREESLLKRKECNTPSVRRKEQVVDGHDYLSRESTSRRTADAGNPTSWNRSESVNNDHKDGDRKVTGRERDSQSTSSQGAQSLLTEGSNDTRYPGNSRDAEAKIPNSTRKVHEETDGSKSNFRGAIPPPYVKPGRGKHNPESNRLEKSRAAPDLHIHEKQGSSTENADGQGSHTAEYYKDDLTLRRRPSRRRQAKPGTSHDEKGSATEAGVVRRVSSSRRRGDSRKGLQILFDDDHSQKNDDEEKIIDKLLLHYSQKPSTVERGNLRRKHKAASTDPSIPSVNEARHRDEAAADIVTTRSKSFSLPRDQATSSEQKKEFTRASSFQQDMLTPAKHVHPKLPDYDDLAARFSALRKNRE